jgi:hypothetical protein
VLSDVHGGLGRNCVQILRFWTSSIILSLSKTPSCVLETGLHLQVRPTQIGLINRCSPYLQTREMSHMQCFEWHKHFEGGRTSLEDDERSARSSMSINPENVERIWELVYADCRRMINNTADTVGMGQCKQS